MTPRRLQPATVTAKLRLLRDLLDDLDTIGTVTPERLTDDRVLLRAVERILTQLVDLAVSVNTHVVTATAGRAPGTYRESFAALVAVGVLPEQLARQLVPSVGLRNLLVHEYAAVDLLLVCRAVPLAQHSYGRYVSAVAGWLAHQPAQ
jgi:uncharacterized protein YutE (UPF0331/DUF86 family)